MDNNNSSASCVTIVLFPFKLVTQPVRLKFHSHSVLTGLGHWEKFCGLKKKSLCTAYLLNFVSWSFIVRTYFFPFHIYCLCDRSDWLVSHLRKCTILPDTQYKISHDLICNFDQTSTYSAFWLYELWELNGWQISFVFI